MLEKTIEILKETKEIIESIEIFAELKKSVLELMENSKFFQFVSKISLLSKIKTVLKFFTHPTVSAIINTGLGIAILVGLSVATGGAALAAIGLGFTALNFVQTMVHSSITERNKINIQKELELVHRAEENDKKINEIYAKHDKLKFLGPKVTANNLSSHEIKPISKIRSVLINLRKHLGNHIVNFISTALSFNPLSFALSSLSFALTLTFGSANEIQEQNHKKEINEYLATKKTQCNLPDKLDEIAKVNINKQAELYALEALSKLPNLSNMSEQDIQAEFIRLQNAKLTELASDTNSLENKSINQSVTSKIKTGLRAFLHVLNPFHDEKNYTEISHEIHSNSNHNLATAHSPNQQQTQANTAHSPSQQQAQQTQANTVHSPNQQQTQANTVHNTNQQQTQQTQANTVHSPNQQQAQQTQANTVHSPNQQQAQQTQANTVHNTNQQQTQKVVTILKDVEKKDIKLKTELKELAKETKEVPVTEDTPIETATQIRTSKDVQRGG